MKPRSFSYIRTATFLLLVCIAIFVPVYTWFIATQINKLGETIVLIDENRRMSSVDTNRFMYFSLPFPPLSAAEQPHELVEKARNESFRYINAWLEINADADEGQNSFTLHKKRPQETTSYLQVQVAMNETERGEMFHIRGLSSMRFREIEEGSKRPETVEENSEMESRFLRTDPHNAVRLYLKVYKGRAQPVKAELFYDEAFDR
ncbi:MAG: hypothetical protein LAT67_13430 [Balneolales bacterium]|nr:hypothetical protein [Balneolales bacterium]